MLIPRRNYGLTEVVVSAIGLGAIPLGNPDWPEREAAALLDQALAAGIRLIDTAPSYGVSEQRIGRWLAPHRAACTLSSKLGYGVAGIEDWTGACIAAGVDQALRRLQTDWLDIAHLHSCPLAILQREDVLRALDDAKHAGKIRAIAYSGEGAALDYAIRCGHFDGCMASLNLFDQRVIDEVIPKLAGRGFIAKRPLANAPWRFTQQPHGDYCEAYWLRWRAMQLPEPGMPWGELALRFALWHPGVSCAVVGTASVAHLHENLKWAANGPLPDDVLRLCHAAFRQYDRDWIGQI